MVQGDRERPHFVVDMTPLGPRGENGGAGLVATSLVRHLSELAPKWTFTVLTREASHTELAALDAPNVQRRCVASSSEAGPRSLGRVLADRVLPIRARMALKRAYHSVATDRRHSELVNELRPDLIFSPLSVPYFFKAGVPSVSIVYDLQHLAYGGFFTPEQRLNRQRHLVEICARSERVVCISEFVRKMVLANVHVEPERVVAIPLGLLHEGVRADKSVITRLGLKESGFILYPANFWPHKNHVRLFEALRQRARRDLTLVCTGVPNAFMSALQQQAGEMLPSIKVVFAGYLNQPEFMGLLEGCFTVVFPSLYEGFAMPVLEAMAVGKPVLCSNVASLPEVAGDAAIYFDPESPAEIASAIDALYKPEEIARITALGRRQAARFGTARQMAERYSEVFEQALSTSSRVRH